MFRWRANSRRTSSARLTAPDITQILCSEASGPSATEKLLSVLAERLPRLPRNALTELVALDDLGLDVFEISIIFDACIELCPEFDIPLSARDGSDLSLLEVVHFFAAIHEGRGNAK